MRVLLEKVFCSSKSGPWEDTDFLLLLDIAVSGSDTGKYSSHLCNPVRNVILRTKLCLEDGRGER